MHVLRRACISFVLTIPLLASHSPQVMVQAVLAEVRAQGHEASQQHDGQHDFDFVIGTWKSHTSRLRHPLTGSSTWDQYDGISVSRKVWNGRANLAELEADGSAGHLQVLCLRLYNPTSHQWNLNYANSTEGTLETPVIGSFKNGRGEF